MSQCQAISTTVHTDNVFVLKHALVIRVDTAAPNALHRDVRNDAYVVRLHSDILSRVHSHVAFCHADT